MYKTAAPSQNKQKNKTKKKTPKPQNPKQNPTLKKLQFPAEVEDWNIFPAW